VEPQTQKRLLLLAALLILLFCLWVTRYGYVSAGEGKMYRVDRWTGKIVYVIYGAAQRVRMPG
jgi:TRAP-type C4-dicarboxylate transport system permease small subunit